MNLGYESRKALTQLQLAVRLYTRRRRNYRERE
jgi:hypothetical protein